MESVAFSIVKRYSVNDMDKRNADATNALFLPV